MMKAVATKRFYCGSWICPEGFPSDGHSREELLTQMNRSLNLLIFFSFQSSRSSSEISHMFLHLFFARPADGNGPRTVTTQYIRNNYF